MLCPLTEIIVDDPYLLSPPISINAVTGRKKCSPLKTILKELDQY